MRCSEWCGQDYCCHGYKIHNIYSSILYVYLKCLLLVVVVHCIFSGFNEDFNFDGLNFRWFPDAPIDIGGGEPQPPAGTSPEDDEPPTSKQLRGFFYTVTEIADNQQSELIVAGAFFYPRFGSVRFIGKNRFSESIPMAVTSGYIPNPNPDWFDDFRYTPYRPGNVAVFDMVWQPCGCDGFPTIQRRQ